MRQDPESGSPDELRRALAAALAELDQLRLQVGRQAEEQESALRAERARIAQEIHDGVAQHLALLSLKLEMLSRLAGTDPERMRSELHKARSILETAVHELRSCIHAPGPPDARIPGG